LAATKHEVIDFSTGVEWIDKVDEVPIDEHLEQLTDEWMVQLAQGVVLSRDHGQLDLLLALVLHPQLRYQLLFNSEGHVPLRLKQGFFIIELLHDQLVRCLAVALGHLHEAVGPLPQLLPKDIEVLDVIVGALKVQDVRNVQRLV
jgi:hypothetical protein